jgi:hypothetical protein
MRLYHLSQMHLVELTPLLTRMETEDLGTVVMDAFERVKAP